MGHCPCGTCAPRDVWLVYGNPADIHSRDMVGVAGVPTRSTGEQTLLLAISFIHIPTLRTRPGGVARVHQNQPHPRPLRLVGDLLSQIVEAPGIPLPPLALSNRYPLQDTLQVLQGNPATGVFRPLHQLLRNPMIFLPALLQQALGRLRALALQAAQPVDLPARVPVRIAVHGDVLHPQVHTQVTVRLCRRRRFLLTGSQQVELSPRFLSSSASCLSPPKGDPLPSPDSPDRDALSFQVVRQDPAIEGNRTRGLEGPLHLVVQLHRDHFSLVVRKRLM